MIQDQNFQHQKQNLEVSKKLVVLGIIFEITYCLFLFVNFFRQKLGDSGLPPLSWQRLLMMLCVFFVLVVIYFFLFKNHAQLIVGIKTVIFFTVLFCLTLAVIIPLGSGDIYYYIFHERALVKYHLNPYTADLTKLSDDPFYNKVSSWGRDYGTTYGPLWLLISAPAAVLAGNSEFLNLFLFRLLAVFFFMGTIWLIYMLFGRLNKSFQLAGTLLYAWNPLILFEVANNGHNEIMIIFFLLLAFWFHLQKKNNFILPCIVAAVLIKYYALVFLPIFIWLIWKDEANIRQRLLTFTKSIELSLILIIVTLLPFWQGVKMFQGAFIQMQAASLPNFFPLAILQKATVSPSSVIQTVGLLVLLLFYVYSFFRPVEGTTGYIKKIFWLYFIYIFFVAMYFQPWYLLGLVPWLLLVPDKKYLWANLIFTGFGLLVYSFYH